MVALFATAAGAAPRTGDSVRGSGTFTIAESTVPNPFVDYNVKLAVDTKSGTNGEAASGRINATLTKPSEAGGPCGSLSTAWRSQMAAAASGWVGTSSSAAP